MRENMILCSTGTFINKKNNYDHSLIAKLHPNLNYQGFELFMFDRFADFPEEYAEKEAEIALATKSGANFYSMHMNKRIGDLISRNEPGDIEAALRQFEFNCAVAEKYGVKLLVLHLWGGFASDKSIDVNLNAFAKLKEISDKYNLILTIENIVCNTYKPLAHMKKLWEMYGQEVKFTIDVRQAEFHKSLKETCESAFLWENNLVPHLHISDYSGGDTDWARLREEVPLGRGDVDFKYFSSFLKSIGFKGSAVVEYGIISENEDLIYNLNKSYEFVRNGLFQTLT
jgi:sugar phosphate isomerase/epimerase